MLDVMIRNDDNTITTDVYRKERHTDHYLQWSNLGIVRTFMNRAETILEDQALPNTEKQKIRDALRVYGYPEWALKECDTSEKLHKTPPTRTRDQDKPSLGYVVLLYVKGVTERLKRTFAKHNFSVYSKPGYTLRNALVKPKDPLDNMEKCGVIYKVGVRNVGRCMSERLKDHWGRGLLNIKSPWTGGTVNLLSVNTKCKQDTRSRKDRLWTICRFWTKNPGIRTERSRRLSTLSSTKPA